MSLLYAETDAGRQELFLLSGVTAAPEEAARAARYLETLTPLFSDTEPKGALKTRLSWSAVVQLEATFGNALTKGPALQDWINDQARRRTTPAAIGYRPPAGLEPYPWQWSGAAMIADVERVVITDEPGTGKTITAIMGLTEWLVRRRSLEHLAYQTFAEAAAGPRPNPILIVCPASVVDAWVEAWRLWSPALATVAWRGPKRKDRLLHTADVYVSSYETARIDAPPGRKPGALMQLRPVAVVVDECHFIKNNTAKRSEAVRRICTKAEAVVGMSGTPITHHPGDLWPTLNAIEEYAQPAKERWVARYCMTLPGDYEDDVLGLLPTREPEYRLTLLGAHRRVAKADVLTQLPPKVYSTRTVDIPAEWRRVYDEFEDQMLAELPDGEELSVFDAMSKFTFLSRLASSAADVETTFGPDEDEFGMPKRHVSLDLKAPSWKVDALLEILAEREGLQTVAFAPSRQLMMIAGERAEAEGYRVGYIVGEQSAKDRTAAVDAFQRGELDLICATTGAGGVGITLTAASTVVFLQRPWSLVESIQAEDRAHRIGSERHESIEIIDILARNTIDTRIRAVLRDRAGQLADLVEDQRIVTELLGGSDRKAA